jgi:hypothetical protein
MKITEAMRDPRAMDDGVWVSPVPGNPEFRVKARIRGQKHQQRIGKYQAEWARIYGSRGAPESVIQEVVSRILFEECIVEFEGLFPDEGFEDVSRDAVQRYCATFQGQPLYVHFLTAANMVEARRAADIEEASGNLEPLSLGI